MPRQISICIPTYNRSEWTIRAFEEVLYDDRVSEVVIVDDNSLLEIYNQLASSVGGMDKVKLRRNTHNVGCYFNKREAISLAENEYAIILDSDNIITPEYLDRIFERAWAPDTILAPDFGEPSLNYSQYSGMVITKENVNLYLGKGNLEMCLNTFNFFINRNNYLKIFDPTVEPVTSDSIWINYLWLKAGWKMMIVPGMKYTHTVHPGSHYVLHNRINPEFYTYVLEELKKLK